MRVTQGAALLAGYFLLVSWVILERAKPQTHTMFDWRWGKKVRSYWNYELASVGEKFLLVSLGMCILGLIIYGQIRKRHKTRAHWALVILGALSLISILFCELSF